MDAQNGDVLVLASDGVWDVFTEETDLMSYVFGRRGGDLTTAAATIVAEAKRRWNEKLDDGFHDDITCIVLGL